MSLSLTNLKILILFCFLVMTFLFGMIPVIFIKYVQRASLETGLAISANINGSGGEPQWNRLSRYKRIMSFLSCFAGGVFLATCLLELLPNVQRSLLVVLLTNKSAYSGFPAAEFVMAMGLFLILVIEQIVLTVKEREPSEYSSIPNEEQPILRSRYPHVAEVNGENRFTESYQSQGENSLGGICDEPHLSPPNSPQPEGSDRKVRSESFLSDREQRQRSASRYSRNSSLDESHAPRHDHHQSHSPVDHRLQTHSTLRAMLLLCALSLHSIFEGITIGLQTEMSSVLSIYAALTVHKSILSFSLGMNLVQSKISKTSTIKSIIGFSVSSPIGVALGIIIMDLWTSTNSVIMQGILQGIASGTFLYIIFFEILPKEFNCEIDRLLKVLFLVFGFAVVTGLIFLGDDAKSPLCKTLNDINP